MMGENARRCFRAELNGRREQIQALREMGWTWEVIAEHFAADVGLGGKDAGHFASAWSKLKKRRADRGVDLDGAAVREAKREAFERLGGGNLWVLKGPSVRAEAPLAERPAAEVRPVPVSARPAVERLPVVSEPGVVERHRMASSAGGVSSSFPVSGKPEAERDGTAAEPIVYSAETLARLEVRLLMAGDHLTAAEFMSELDFPRPVAEAAVFEQRKVKAIRGPQPVLTLFRRLAFHAMLLGKPDALAFVERLPGAAEWAALRREGVLAYEDAARRLGV